MTNRVARSALALPVGILLSLSLATSAIATSWEPPVRIADNRYAGLGLETFVALDETDAIVVFERSNQEDIRDVLVTRTTDAGVTWRWPRVITKHGYWPSAGGYGDFADVVWLWDGRVWYARSEDRGASFAQPVALTSNQREHIQPRVARGANGLVIVVWGTNGGVSARISTDGGLTFGGERQVINNSIYAQVSIADNRIYVLANGRELRFKRSVDNGETWRPAFEITKASYAESMAADGNDVYVAYEYQGGSGPGWPLRYRYSGDGGVTWSDQRRLIPKGWDAYSPFITVNDGQAHAIFEPCVFDFDICSDVGVVVYTQSDDGINWTEPQRVSPLRHYSWPVAIGFVGRTVALFKAFEGGNRVVLYSRAEVP